MHQSFDSTQNLDSKGKAMSQPGNKNGAKNLGLTSELWSIQDSNRILDILLIRLKILVFYFMKI